MHSSLVRNHIKVKRKIPPGKCFSIMSNWHPSDSYSRTHNDFRNAQEHCVDAFSRFSELVVDYLFVYTGNWFYYNFI